VSGSSPAYFYKLTSADIGHLIQVVITATDSENQTGQATSNALGPVTGPSPPVNTVPPVVTGTAQDGQYLKVSNDGTWTSPDHLTFTYQWQRCDSDGTNCSNVSGSSPAYFYKLTSADVGHLIQVVITATDSENQTGQATSNALGPVTSGGGLGSLLRRAALTKTRPIAHVRAPAGAHAPRGPRPRAHVLPPASARAPRGGRPRAVVRGARAPKRRPPRARVQANALGLLPFG
jgi:hypothetical protein